MNKEEERLRQAFAELAREETEELENSLTFEEMRQAEDMYSTHRDRALKAIRGRKKRPWGRYLAAAAALALLLGGALLSWRHTLPDRTPASQPPDATVAPYHTLIPTETHLIPLKETQTPTNVPIPDQKETETPTRSPHVEDEAWRPEGWTGQHYPQALKEGYALTYLTQEDGRHIAAYTHDGKELLFTEYDEIQTVATAGEAEHRYVELPHGLIALRTETDAVVTVTWDQDGHTLTVATEGTDAEEIAGSVIKLSDQ